MKNFEREVKDAAICMLAENAERIAAEAVELGEVRLSDCDWLQDYHFETNIDRDWTLLEAAQILEQLPNETDQGLWEGLSPHDAVRAQAAYTFGNAVWLVAEETLEDLQSSPEVNNLINQNSPRILAICLQKRLGGNRC